MFSVVIATRHRPALLQRALGSVAAQENAAWEAIVVVDGATGADLADYQALAQRHQHLPVRWLHLPWRAAGHGPSFARNQGIEAAQGAYVGFLDDDDLWCDTQHLQRVQQALATHGEIDLYLSAQRALRPDGTPHPGPLWLDSLAQEPLPVLDAQGHRRVTAATLAGHVGFAHLNCSVYRRSFLQALGGLDEQLRYEEDRDLYLRAIDAAALVVYNPAVTAQHHIPERSARSSASTREGRLPQLLQQLRLFDKCLLSARHPALRQQARVLKSYALRELATLMQGQGRLAEAAAYQREACALRPGLQALAGALIASLRTLRQPQP